MFELGGGDAATLRALVGDLGEVGSADDPKAMLEQVEALERVKCAAAAAQARITADFDDARHDAHPAHAVPDASLGAEVGLARHQSPHCGRRKLHLSRALADLPETLAALTRGDIDERRAEIIATGTADLSLEHRGIADREIAGELRYLGDRDLQLLVQRIVYRLDEAGAVRRRERRRPDDGSPGATSATAPPSSPGWSPTTTRRRSWTRCGSGPCSSARPESPVTSPSPSSRPTSSSSG